MSDFQVTLRVGSARLATVLEALTGAATLVSVLPCAEPGEVKSTPRAPRFAHGKRDKGIGGKELALAALKKSSSSLTTKQLGNIFAAQGFSRNSPSPALSALKANGLIEQVEPGRYRITEAGKKEAQDD